MKNYFEIFDLPQSCEIDVNELEIKYIELQRQFHPDKINSQLDNSSANQPSINQNSALESIEHSMLINQAFEVLSNKKSRLSYILQLNGIDIENDSVAPKVDQTTLFEILEIQEQIPDLSKEQLKNLRKETEENFKKLLEISAQNIEEKEFLKAAQNLIKSRYFDKIVQDIKKLLKNL